MATYYVDFDSAGVGHAGTTGDPLSTVDWRAQVEGAVAHSFFQRGDGTLSASILAGAAHTFNAWDVTLYGPWRLYAIGYDIRFYSCTVYDGIIYVTGMPGDSAVDSCGSVIRSFVYAAVSAWFKGTIADSTIITGSNEMRFANGVSVVQNSVLKPGTILQSVSAVTVQDCATNKANWGAFTDFATDLGGNIYGATTKALPNFLADAGDFNLFPFRGVGTPGCWAEPVEKHVNIINSYDSTVPREGSVSSPGSMLDLTTRSTPYLLVNFGTINMRGVREMLVGESIVVQSDYAVLDGRNSTDPTVPNRWAINGAGATLGFGALDGMYTTIKRLCIRQGTLGFDGQEGSTFEFQNCYFRNPSSISFAAGRTTHFVFKGCTFYTNRINFGYAGITTFEFIDCVFFDTVFHSAWSLWYINISAENCWFFGKSEAEVVAGVPEWPPLTFCKFSQGVVRYPPEPDYVTVDNMSYLLYGIPAFLDPISRTRYVTGGYDIGFAETYRYGIGAFYFSTASLTFTPTPSSGAAPLDVSFAAGGEWYGATPVKYLWDFGDGSNSIDKAPEHTYKIPGEWIVTLTVWFNNGQSVTYVGDPIYTYDADYLPGVPIISKTDRCYRTPVLPGDGFGPSEYKDSERVGYDWVWPAARVGVAKCYDEVNREVAIVWDAKTQRRYQINDPDIWKDRVGGEGYDGARIVSEIHHKADSASVGEHAAIVHVEHHSYFNAFDPEKRSEPGYDADAYPDGMRVDSIIHTDDNPIDTVAISRSIPKDGDIVFTERLEARSIQLRKRIFGAPWFYTGSRVDYDTIDKSAKASLRQMSEEDWQDMLSGLPLFHIARDINRPVRNLATGEDCGGAFDNFAEGPDGKTDSALAFVAGSFGFTEEMAENLDGDFSIMMWVRRAVLSALPVRIWSLGPFEAQIVDTLGVRTVEVTDGVGTWAFPLTGTGVEWEHVAIIRETLYIKVYQNGVWLGTVDLTTAVNIGNMLDRCGGDGLSIADPVIVPRAVTIGALEYYCEDVLRGGNQVMKEF